MDQQARSPYIHYQIKASAERRKATIYIWDKRINRSTNQHEGNIKIKVAIKIEMQHSRTNTSL
ncbi:hypothetical protein CsSME_00043117 [Camellia sinensis var. sinensis]